jgi:eukaryotic-like serine/threonine-protein kinase
MKFKRLLAALLIISAVQAISCKNAKVAIPTSLSDVASGPGRTLWWIYRDGREEAIKAPPANYYFPKISPDGTKIAVTVQLGQNRDIYILDLAQGAFPQFTSGQGDENQPLWSPDGQQIAFSSSVVGWEMAPNAGISGVVWKPANGSAKAKALAAIRDKWIFPFSWTRDGKALLTGESSPDFQNMDIGMISVENGGRYTLILKEQYHEVQPQLSPDSRWLAYCTSEMDGGQRTRVYVSPFPDVRAGKWQVSSENGNSPRWSPDGKELYYLIGGNIAETAMAVGVETQPTFRPGKARVLFRGRYLGSLPNNGIPYDVHPDGQKFLMIKP